MQAKGMMGTARTLLGYALKVYLDTKSLRRRAADLEKAHETA